MKVIIAILLLLIGAIGFVVGSAIMNEMREDDTEILGEMTDEIENADAIIPTQSVNNARADFVTIAVSSDYTSNGGVQLLSASLTDDDAIIDATADGIINFAVSFDDANNSPFIFNIPAPDSATYGDDAFSVATFVFHLDNTDSNSNPFISFIPGQYNLQEDNTQLYATYFVSFDDAGSNNPYMFTIPIPEITAGAYDNTVTSVAAAFVISNGNGFNGVNQFMPDATPPTSSSDDSDIRGLRVLSDDCLVYDLLGTWVYRGGGAHVEMTFMNDRRYYEITYSPSGRPLSWEYGVYSTECGTFITIQSSSIWSPTYNYRFSINNNTLTFTYRGNNYVFKRQNTLPILSLERYPYSLWQTWDRSYQTPNNVWQYWDRAYPLRTDAIYYD